MRIDMLEIGTVLVTMGEKEQESCGLDFSADSAKLKKALQALLLRVDRECGLKSRGRSYLVEAFPARSGCLLLISTHTVERRRRVWRIKKQSDFLACFLDHADAMLDLLRSDNAPESYELYLLRGSYVLAAPQSDINAAALSEYGTLLRLNAVSLARLREYGTKLDYPRKSCKEAI